MPGDLSLDIAERADAIFDVEREITGLSAETRSLIVTAKMNDIGPQAWLADVLARLPDTPMSRLPELLPWHWKGKDTGAKEA